MHTWEEITDNEIVVEQRTAIRNIPVFLTLRRQGDIEQWFLDAWEVGIVNMFINADIEEFKNNIESNIEFILRSVVIDAAEKFELFTKG